MFPSIKNVAALMAVMVIIFCLDSCSQKNAPDMLLDRTRIASEYFQEDTSWFLKNIPFFECSDKEIEQVYYYRWKVYKAHVRRVGDNQFVITEFINHVPWDRDPFCTIDAASQHHIYEGRWLRDDRYVDGYIENLVQDGGDNRQYSEGIADAVYNRFLVNGDSAFIESQLDSMKAIYNRWDDHWEASKNLYYIPAMPDATEYTIASIDASGGKDGFAGGEAFRPTINSYMYGNALAIARVATMKGDTATATEFFRKAASLKANVQASLWNDSLQHFTDRFKVDNQFVHYWNFIRGRELAGLIPWYYDLPDDRPMYSAAWRHAIDTMNLLGKYGFRTNEPSYEYYFRQFVFFEGKPGSQWNGPSWPYQTTQVITGMANLLNDYHQDVVTNADYLHVLRLYTKQHYLPGGKIDLVENYDPNNGGPIVHYYWSNHYNHSGYDNLVISGLCGIRPSAGDTLDIHPLIDSSIRYFCLEGVAYHGHRLTLVYDADGSRYKLGKGLTVFVDGRKVDITMSGERARVYVGKRIRHTTAALPPNHALNIRKTGYPSATASVNAATDSVYQAIDGRVWYFTEITNRWTTQGSVNRKDWISIDFGQELELTAMNIYPFADGQGFALPDSTNMEFDDGTGWKPVKTTDAKSIRLVANTENTIHFERIKARRVRINFVHFTKDVAVSEIEFY